MKLFLNVSPLTIVNLLMWPFKVSSLYVASAFFAKIASLIFFLSPYCRSFSLLTFVALISWLLLSDITSFAVIWAFLFCLFFWSSLFFLFSILSLLANWLPHTYSKVQKKITLLPIKRLLWTLQNNCIYTIFNKDQESMLWKRNKYVPRRLESRLMHNVSNILICSRQIVNFDVRMSNLDT